MGTCAHACVLAHSVVFLLPLPWQMPDLFWRVPVLPLLSPTPVMCVLPGTTVLAFGAVIPALEAQSQGGYRTESLRDEWLQAWLASACRAWLLRGGASNNRKDGFDTSWFHCFMAKDCSSVDFLSECCWPQGRGDCGCRSGPGEAEQRTPGWAGAAAFLRTEDGTFHFSCERCPDFKTRPKSSSPCRLQSR